MRIASFLGIAIVVLSSFGCVLSTEKHEPVAVSGSANPGTSDNTTVTSAEAGYIFPKGDYLPSNQYLVGGGFMIKYFARSVGTAILVNKTSGQILMTRTLKQAEEFEISINPASPNEQEKKFFGEDMSKVQLLLYFVPNNYNDAK